MALFDNINAFMALRDSMSQGLAPVQEQAPSITEFATPEIQQTGAQAPAPVQSPQQNFTTQPLPATGTKVGQLVDYGGKKVASTSAPYFQKLQAQFPGLRFTSGYRDPKHNAAVGGVKNSYHLSGRAADFVGSAKDMQNGAAWARANGAKEVLVHSVKSGQHLHVGW